MGRISISGLFSCARHPSEHPGQSGQPLHLPTDRLTRHFGAQPPLLNGGLIRRHARPTQTPRAPGFAENAGFRFGRVALSCGRSSPSVSCSTSHISRPTSHIQRPLAACPLPRPPPSLRWPGRSEDGQAPFSIHNGMPLVVLPAAPGTRGSALSMSNCACNVHALMHTYCHENKHDSLH